MPPPEIQLTMVRHIQKGKRKEMSFHTAAAQFDENITLLGGEAALAAADPEKYNLYAGLLNMARGGSESEVSGCAARAMREWRVAHVFRPVLAKREE
jgi:hypothetical protein